MIIKPITNQKELEQYLTARRLKNGNLKVSNTIEKNIAINHKEYEIDAYDSLSFHFGAFENEKLYACTRLVNDKYDTAEKTLYAESKVNHLIKDLSKHEEPKNAIGLLDYASKKEDINDINAYFNDLRSKGERISEVTRLIRALENDDKYLMSYMLCYAWAVNRFLNIGYCFSEANKVHSKFYQQTFNCKPILEHIKLNPIKGGEDFIMMIATMNDLSPQMDMIVKKMEHKFNEANAICPVKLDEIRIN